jgi:hypothetical protein
MGPMLGPMADLRPRASIQKSPGFRDSNSTGDIDSNRIGGVFAVQLHVRITGITYSQFSATGWGLELVATFPVNKSSYKRHAFRGTEPLLDWIFSFVKIKIMSFQITK